MGQIKQGLDYFPFSIGLLKDRKLRRPKLKYGCVVIDIYLSLLELIYADKGYYIDYNEKTKDDIIWEILENLQGKYTPTAETVEQVIEDLVACGLFSGDHFKAKILTSKRIQQTFYSATVERKAVVVNFDIWLLSLKEMEELSTRSIILQKFLNRSNNEDNRPNEQANQPIAKESKVNKSKVNNITSNEVKESKKGNKDTNNQSCVRAHAHEDFKTKFAKMSDEELLDFGNQTTISVNDPEFNEMIEAYHNEIKRRQAEAPKFKGKIIKNGGTFKRLESYEDIINNNVDYAPLRRCLWLFIQHCQLNDRKVTNEKLYDIIFELDERYLEDNSAKCKAIKEAINKGYYDIKRD